MNADIKIDHHLVAVDAEHHVHVMLELMAPDAPKPSDRPPLNVALVIDRSGSMSGEKLAAARDCAAWVAKRLSSQDQLGVVAFDDQVDLVSPLAPAGTDAQLHAIAGLWPGGSTNLSGGWLKGRELLASASADSVRRVVLLTDGQANVGVLEPPQLTGMTSAAGTDGITTTTIGFGDDFAETLLTSMADSGGGNAHYAPTADAAPAIFATEFEGLASVVAQNVSVEIRPTDDVAMLGVLNDYPATPVAGGIQLNLGDSYGSERPVVIFELHVPSVAALGVAKVAEVVLRYVTVGDDIAAHELTLPIVVNVVSADEAAASDPDLAVVEEVTILKAATAREEARRRADEGDFEGGRALMLAAADELRSLAPRSPRAGELCAEADALVSSLDVMSPIAYNASTAKALHFAAHASRRRRRPPK